MSKYLVETYYTCTFKVNHYLDDINETDLKNLEKRDDGKFEVLEVKLDNRKTKSLDPNNNKIIDNKKIDVVSQSKKPISDNIENIVKKGIVQTDDRIKKRTSPKKDVDTLNLEQDIKTALGLNTTIDHNDHSGGGRILIRYKNLEQLDIFCSKIMKI